MTLLSNLTQMKMNEVPKRLTPEKKTLREIYLKSGNQCAFPGCGRVMINDEGDFVGQVCHIEAALPGGERFNKNMTNEERRSFENLMLMCYDHHIITNKVDEYPTKRLKQMKRKHEARFTGIVDKIQDEIRDYTRQQAPSKAKRLGELNRVLEWGADKEQLEWTVESLESFANQVSRIPRPTRQFLAVLVERSRLTSGDEIMLVEIEEACGMKPHEVKSKLAILDGHGMTHGIYPGKNNQAVTSLRNHDQWPIWEELYRFCKKKDIPIETLIVDLEFDILD